MSFGDVGTCSVSVICILTENAFIKKVADWQGSWKSFLNETRKSFNDFGWLFSILFCPMVNGFVVIIINKY